MERTLAIVKPDAVAKNLVGTILQRIEDSGLRIVALRMLHMTLEQAEGFYEVHRGKPFYKALTEFMSSGPCVVATLEGDDAILRWRTLMGTTNPADADAGTLRKEFAESIDHNAVHGSDAPETAAEETAYFFRTLERVVRS